MDILLPAHAAVVSATIEEGYWQVSFADNRDDPTTYLICQNAFEYDGEDRRSGTDSHYVELNDQSLSAYGGVDRVFLQRDRMSFVFTPEVAELFGLPHGLCLAFELDDARYADLVSLSKKIFEGRMMLVDE
jgi:hypothetical protein